MSVALKTLTSPQQIYRMFNAFFQLESSGGIVLIVCALAAVLWANAPFSDTYAAFWQQEIGLTLSGWHFRLSLHEWINDGLMAVFFLVVGLEIKREVLIGELSSPRQAMLPILAAIGGMICPALIYIACNPPGSPGHIGWGIPTVTDIAFSLGVLALLGNRVPFGLKVFLVALAISDDLGAVLLIAGFYSSHIDWQALVQVLCIFILTLGFNRIGLRHPVAYAVPGIAMWALMLHSGVHATLAGVLLALAIPSRSKIEPKRFHAKAQKLLQDFSEAGLDENSMFSANEHLNSVKALEVLCEKAVSPLQSFERAIHPWTTYIILPLFALANAGVSLAGISPQTLWNEPMPLGIILGLVFGKQIGVTLFSWLAVQCKLGSLPAGVNWFQLYAVSWLAGIGFTMSIFVANLAFPNPATLSAAKLAIFSASILAALSGLFIVWLTVRHAPLDDGNENTP